MTSDRYLPRAPSLRPTPKRRAFIERMATAIATGQAKLGRTLTPDEALARGEQVASALPALVEADLPAPPARGPWEPKED